MDRFYSSPSTGEKCTAAQYVAEIICVRGGKRRGNDLAFKFWNKQQKKGYQGTIVAVSRLMSAFGEKEVVSFFDNDGKNIYYIGFYHPIQWVKDAVSKYAEGYRKKEQQKLSVSKEVEDEEAVSQEVVIPKRSTKKTLFGVLNGKKEDRRED